MKNDPHIFIVAAEKSGDELGAGLVRELRTHTGGAVELSAIGGSALATEGLESAIDISPLSILGFVEGLKHYPVIMERVAQATDAIIAANADAAVLIDSWGFMARVAKRLKKQGYKGEIIKYVAPQVWAMREGRAKVLAGLVDHLLTIHSFDAPYFTKYGLNTIYVGNPILDEDYSRGDGAELRSRYKIADETPVLSVLFGSRLSEIQKLAAPFASAVGRLKKAMPELAIVAPVSDTITEDVLAAAAEYPELQDVIMLSEETKLDCFAAADVAIACSGTVTSQLASAGVPSVVGYKLNALTYMIASRLYKPNYVSIVNIAADKALMPEFLQEDCTGENLANAALAYLQNNEVRTNASQALLRQIKNMRQGKNANSTQHSSTRAANAVLEILGRVGAE